MKKLLSVFFVLIILICMFVFNSYAFDVGEDFPSYCPISGGAWIEVDSSLGRGVLVLPLNYKNDSIGYLGNGYSLCNLLSSTINGYFYTTNGTPYTVRATRQMNFEYSTSSGYSTIYTDLGITEIFNSNCDLIDNTGARDFRVTDNYQRNVIVFLGLIFVLTLFISIGRFGYVR